MEEVAIIGAGVMGLATAHALACAGHKPVVYEQFARGHERGSSHGRSRVFRLAYTQPEWVRLAQEALQGWRALEAERGEPLLELTGLIEIVSDLRDSSAAALDVCGVPWKRLDREQAERRFGLRLPAGTFGVMQPEAGIVRADRALAAFAQNVEVRYGMRIDSLDELDARCVVVTAGAWVNDLVRPPLAVRVTRETVAYFRTVRTEPMPSFVSYRPVGRGTTLYALADPVHGLKAAGHHAGPQADPNERGQPDDRLIDEITTWVGQHVALAEPHPVQTQTCLYTTTSDESFILERRGRVVIGSPCSGHGFKFAPAIGARLAALVKQTL